MAFKMAEVQKPRKTVLIVEDDPLLIKMYKTKFETEGFQVIVAQDGQEGLNIASSCAVDFAIFDIMMPKISGLDLLEKLRSTEKCKKLPVIVLSNLSQESQAKRALELGAKEYLLKANLTPSEVVEKVKKYLK